MRKALGFLTVSCLVVAACTSGDTATTSTSSTMAPPAISRVETTTEAAPTTEAAATLAWTPCGDIDCATLTVPLDHDDPSKGTIDLAVARRLADSPDRRIGVLLTNPGGPGFSGTQLVADSEYAFSLTLRRHFDIVSWDPRGVSTGTVIDCKVSADHWNDYDLTPDSPEEAATNVELLDTYATKCSQAAGDLLPYYSTKSTVRDMDALRIALGEDEVSYLGYSYGTAIGSIYATMFPEAVRAMVLDGAYDISGDIAEFIRERFRLLESHLDTALNRCATSTTCPIYNAGDPFAVFDAVAATLEAGPIVLEGWQIEQGNLLDFTYWSLLQEEWWPDFYGGLAAARDGDPRFISEYLGAFVGAGPDSVHAIDCLDWPRAGILEASRQREALIEVAPRIASLAGLASVCTHWAVQPDLPPAPSAAGAGEILVIGTTGDAATPLTATRALVDRLESATLLISVRNNHGAYSDDPMASCVTGVVDAYLIDLELPADESVCEYRNQHLLPPGAIEAAMMTNAEYASELDELRDSAGPGRIIGTVQLTADALPTQFAESHPMCVGSGDYAAIVPGAVVTISTGVDHDGFLGGSIYDLTGGCGLWFGIDVDEAETYTIAVGGYAATFSHAQLEAADWIVTLFNHPEQINTCYWPTPRERCKVLERLD